MIITYNDAYEMIYMGIVYLRIVFFHYTNLSKGKKKFIIGHIFFFQGWLFSYNF